MQRSRTALRLGTAAISTGLLTLPVPSHALPAGGNHAEGGVSRIMTAPPRPETFRTPDGKLGWKLHVPGGKPLATPAYDGGMVFIGGGYGSHEFYALDSGTGEVKWQVRTGDDGPTAAIVHRGRVIFNTESCTLYVLDARNGREVWSRWLGDPLMNQPAAEGDKIYMAYPDSKGRTGGGHRLACFELETGKTIWDSPVETDIISAPVLAEDGVYATCMDGTIYRFDKENGRLLWKNQRQATSAPLIRNGEVYATVRETTKGRPGSPEPSIHEEKVVSYAVAGGEVRQKEMIKRPAMYLAHANADEVSAQAAQDASVGFGSAPAAAKLGKAQENISTLGTVSAGWRYQGSRGAYADGHLYNAMGDTVTCVDPKSGAKLWEQKFDNKDRGRLLTPPSIAGDQMAVGTYSGNVTLMSRKDGKKSYDIPVGAPVTFQPALAKGWIYAGTEAGTIVGVNTGDATVDGWPMWGGSPGHNK